MEQKKRSLAVATSLLIFVLLLHVTPAFADVPVFISYQLVARENHLFLNFLIRHNSPTSVHYVDLVQIDVDGTVHDVNLDSQTEVDFSIEYDLGEISTIPPSQARAHCTVHGWSAWADVTLPSPTPSPPTSIEYNPGVLADRGISYLVSAEPPTGLWWMLIRVVAVSGKEVTLSISGEFENGTTTENTAVYNVETGTMNGMPSTFGPIIAANLKGGDPLSTEPPGSDMAINRTEVRTYLGTSRNVNVLDVTTSTADFTNRWTFVYDQITGIMLEMETEFTQSTPTQTTMKMSMSVHGTDIFQVPTSSPPTPSSPTPTPTQTITPTPTVTPPGTPTVGPPTGTPSPTATGTPASTETPVPTPTATPDSMINVLFLPVGILITIIIAAVAIVVVAVIIIKTGKNKSHTP